MIQILFRGEHMGRIYDITLIATLILIVLAIMANVFYVACILKRAEE